MSAKHDSDSRQEIGEGNTVGIGGAEDKVKLSSTVGDPVSGRLGKVLVTGGDKLVGSQPERVGGLVGRVREELQRTQTNENEFSPAVLDTSVERAV